ncbi:Uncharacterized protein Rs2_06313 [Raphanus sativus]|uniref:Uncharacterized protein LOC108840498 n=1 Tax=Raphanus sativus TaxID=3726 RepID=A0A6J0MB97_RAPSA|nr:uncharacterized protein LOC108840498 [Raphanus sativus]KAJ4911692.1 Uncharacterized protein Rs2_06313 [Raphanus sativus]
MNPSTSTEPSLGEKQPSLRRSPSTPSLCCGGSTAAEFCGGTTADFAALCCCGPCSVVSLVVLAVYKIPRGLCRRMRRRGNGDSKLSKVGSSKFAVHPSKEEDEDLDKLAMELKEEGEEDDEEAVALEKEMWNRFYSGGFWRSLSQAETASSPKAE